MSKIIDPVVVDEDIRLDVPGLYDFGTRNIAVGRYGDGSPSLVALDASGDTTEYVVLTVAIPGSVLMPGTAILDGNNLTPDIVDVLKSLGVVENQLGSIRSGFVNFPIVQLTQRYAEAFDELEN